MTRSAITQEKARCFRLGSLGLVAWMLCSPGVAPAQGVGFPGEDIRLSDAILIQLVGSELMAFDALGGGSVATRLELGERLIWTGVRGRVGIALTDRRLLGVTPQAGSWRERRYLVNESRAGAALLGERVALVLTSRRALGFGAESASWREEDFGPDERVISSRAGEAAAVVVTQRRALGLSPGGRSFVAASLNVQERFEALSATAGVATVTTSRRILTYLGTSRRWSERSLPLR